MTKACNFHPEWQEDYFVSVIIQACFFLSPMQREASGLSEVSLHNSPASIAWTHFK